LNKGPVSIAVDSANIAFQFYTRGILKELCGTDLTHAVLAIGYGVENGVEFIRVKNSWSTSWGEKGYVRIKLDDSNVCGILSEPSQP